MFFVALKEVMETDFFLNYITESAQLVSNDLYLNYNDHNAVIMELEQRKKVTKCK